MSNGRLSDVDLQQIDADYVASLAAHAKDRLIVVLADELKEARDRLNQNSQNSSRPPRSEPPWQGGATKPEGAGEECDSAAGDVEEQTEPADRNTQAEDKGEEPAEPSDREDAPKEKGKPGRRKGMQGDGRRVDLPVSGETIHHPEHCCVCALALDPCGAKAWTAVYVLDLTGGTSALPGLQLTHTKHIYTEIRCACAHVTRAQPGRCDQEDEWKVALSEWHLAGPMLVSLIVCLTQRLRCSRRLTQEFLSDWFGVYLCTSTINQCVHEAGRAVAPVEDQLAAEINEADLVHGDETTWQEAGQLLWLWVFCSSAVTLCIWWVIAPRRSLKISWAASLPAG